MEKKEPSEQLKRVLEEVGLNTELSLQRLFFAELAIFGKTPMKLPLAKRSFDLDLDIWLGNRKEPNSQMHVQWFH